MKRVLFINAADPVSEVENRYRPLWPGYLAAYAEKRLGSGLFEFRFMTGRLDNELDSFKPDIVAISCVSQNYNYAITCASVAKRHGMSVVIGGIHISLVPTSLTNEMDVGCIGEGEETFVELLRHDLDFGGFRAAELGGINGIAFRRDGELVVTAGRAVCPVLDEIPHPKRSLIGYQRHDYMFTSRGCPYRCVFCASSRYWSKVRYASAEHVVEEIKELIAHGVETISFYDDLFIANQERLRTIADMIVADDLQRKVKFTCSCRANLVTPEVVEILKSMNVVSVGMGLESGNDRVLGYLKGNVSVRDNSRAIKLLKDAGIQANASFVIGSPGETEAEMMETYNFIKNSRLDFFDIYTLTPLPGTPVWDYAAGKKMVSDDMDWSRLNVNFEVNADKAIVLSEKLGREKIVRIYKKFRRLRLYRIIMALPKSPWLRDLPRTAVRLFTENLLRLFRQRRKERCC
ncbi:B12-binding domain-containing radical SAM protein [Verrucomicrobiota bacterium]